MEFQASRYDQKLEFILRTAARIFAEKNYHSTSMRDISRETNISLAGLYHYCKSKEELLFLIQDNCFGRVLERLEQQLQEVDDPVAKLRIFIENHLSFFAANMAEMKVLSHEAESLRGDLHAHVSTRKDNYTKLARRVLQEVQESTQSKQAVDLTVATYALFGMMNWIYNWYDPQGKLKVHDLAQHLTRLFLGGFVPGIDSLNLTALPEQLENLSIWRGTPELMNFYSDETYGEHVAGVYDEWYADYDRHAIDFLGGLAGNGRALELGIGTGRFALPLTEKNVEVQGIDAAPSMISRLRAKPGGERITITQGNFADVSVAGEFALVYIVFNTFFALTTQEEQVRCFRNVAAHLASGGCFVIEAFVPDLARFTGDQVNWATKVTMNEVQLDVGQHDAAAQRVMSQKVVITEGNVRLYPVQIRYAWPSELDLMAQLAGLRLRERWSSWQREPFSSNSKQHISVYQK